MKLEAPDLLEEPSRPAALACEVCQQAVTGGAVLLGLVVLCQACGVEVEAMPYDTALRYVGLCRHVNQKIARRRSQQ